MSLLIVGTGALACLFAAKLASAGFPVSMVGSWQPGLVALQSQGVFLHELDGTVRNYAVEAFDALTCPGDFEQALVLVKSWKTPQAAERLQKCLSMDGIVLTLQNGLGNAEILGAALGDERVALGVTMLGARMLEPGHVQFTGEGKIFLGEHPRLGTLEQTLRASGFIVETIPDPKALLWGKLVINASINPLTALLRVPNGELLERPEAHDLMAGAASEVAQVATNQGIRLPYPDPVKVVEDVARGTASNYSSMLQDVLRGTSTEIDSINGEIVRAGERLGVPTPINRMLWQLVSSLDGGG